MNLGARIRSWREWKGWTQAQLAEKSSLSRAAICQYESGKGTPSDDALGVIAKALGLTVEHRVERSGTFYGPVPAAKKTKAAKRAVA